MKRNAVFLRAEHDLQFPTNIKRLRDFILICEPAQFERNEKFLIINRNEKHYTIIEIFTRISKDDGYTNSS